MRRSCESCGRQFEAKSQRARFCSSTCRGRQHRAGDRATVTEFRARDDDQADEPVTVVAATRRTLVAADRLESPAGAAAMVIAAKLDRGGDTGSAVAALVRELRAAVAEATAGVKMAADPLDEIARKREERLARAGGA